MQRIEVTQDFSAPVETVYAHLARHENLERVFGATITRLRDGDTTPDGVGSVRLMKVSPLLPPFEETVTQAVPNELIEYRITRGSPLKDHVGVMRFSPAGTGTRLDYTIEFDSRVPGAGGVLKQAIEQNVRSGLAQIAAEL
ncbi:MAG TPA: SRPBCC family protein [Mycobacteriales bacterium]|nr:SRPBCC family protein [Mycobacteriales bacterium]